MKKMIFSMLFVIFLIGFISCSENINENPPSLKADVLNYIPDTLSISGEQFYLETELTSDSLNASIDFNGIFRIVKTEPINFRKKINPLGYYIFKNGEVFKSTFNTKIRPKKKNKVELNRVGTNGPDMNCFEYVDVVVSIEVENELKFIRKLNQQIIPYY